MGSGSFDGKKFELFATFDYDAPTEKFSHWKNSFRAASKALFDATDGQMSIGSVTVSNSKSGGDVADAVLKEHPGKSSTTDPIKPSTPGNLMVLKDDERFNSGVIVHEFGHYLFGLEDEYLNIVDCNLVVGECTDDAAGEHACIMEFSGDGIVIDPSSGIPTILGIVNEFCCAANHSSSNIQEKKNGKSCWDTIVQNWGNGGAWGSFPGIVAPSTGNRPAGTPPKTGPAEVLWHVVPLRTRYLFVLSDAGIHQLSYSDFFSYFVVPLTFLEANIELKFLVPPSKDEDFSKEIKLSFPQWKVAREYSREVFSLNNLNRGLEASAVSNQRAVFYGMPTTALDNLVTEDANQLTSKILRKGFVAHTIAESSGIQELAFRTNGVNRILFTGNQDRSRVHNVSQIMATVFETLEHWEMASDYMGVLPNAINQKQSDLPRYSAEDLERVRRRPTDTRLWAKNFDFPVFIEKGATQAAFVLCLPRNSQAWLYLQKPNGEIVNPKDLSITFLEKTEYKLYLITQNGGAPIDGQWFVRIERAAAPGPTPFKILAFSRNVDLRTSLRVIPAAQPNQFTLNVSIAYQWLPVCNVSPIIAQLNEYSDSGELVSLRLIELTQTGGSDQARSFHSPSLYSAPIQHSSANKLAIRVALSNVGSATLLDPEPPELGRRTDSVGLAKEQILQALPAIPAFNRVLETFIGPKPKM